MTLESLARTYNLAPSAYMPDEMELTSTLVTAVIVAFSN